MQSNTTQNTLPKKVYIGGKIPADLAKKIDELSLYIKGGKSEVLRRALCEGLPIVIDAHFLTFPMHLNNKDAN